MTEEEHVAPQKKEFSEDYIKQLRDEAATWRKKTRELEAQVSQSTIALEFTKRGIQAEPSWLTVMEGQTIPEAVEDFVGKYPNLVAGPIESTPNPQFRSGQPPLPPQASKANVPGPGPNGALTGRDLESIKKDPTARRELTDMYRGLISQNTHTPSYEG